MISLPVPARALALSAALGATACAYELYVRETFQIAEVIWPGRTHPDVPPPRGVAVQKGAVAWARQATTELEPTYELVLGDASGANQQVLDRARGHVTGLVLNGDIAWYTVDVPPQSGSEGPGESRLRSRGFAEGSAIERGLTPIASIRRLFVHGRKLFFLNERELASLSLDEGASPATRLIGTNVALAACMSDKGLVYTDARTLKLANDEGETQLLEDVGDPLPTEVFCDGSVVHLRTAERRRELDVTSLAVAEFPDAAAGRYFAHQGRVFRAEGEVVYERLASGEWSPFALGAPMLGIVGIATSRAYFGTWIGDDGPTGIYRLDVW